MVLAQEAFTSVLIVTDQNGNVATGKTISYRIFDENLSLWNSGSMTEIGSYGIYYKTWTPDADGYWIFEAYYVGSDFKFYDIEMYQVGKGVEDAIFERLGAPAFSTIAGDIANLITRTKGLDDIHDDLDTHDVDIKAEGERENPHISISEKEKRSAWARLLSKIYEVHAFVCPKCSSDMHIIAVIIDPIEIRTILRHLVKIGRSPLGLNHSCLK